MCFVEGTICIWSGIGNNSGDRGSFLLVGVVFDGLGVVLGWWGGGGPWLGGFGGGRWWVICVGPFPFSLYVAVFRA